MSEEAALAGDKGDWYVSKTLVIAWVLIFFPVGLYGVWKSDDFIKNVKFGISVACVMGFFSLGINFTSPIYMFGLFPIALVLLWRDKDISNMLTMKFAAAYPVVLAFALLIAPRLSVIALF